MSRFNIKEDLEFRSDDQKLEILAISGPSAERVMRALTAQRYAEVEATFSIRVNPAVARRIVQRFSERILR